MNEIMEENSNSKLGQKGINVIIVSDVELVGLILTNERLIESVD